jgi:hypothetical protein
MATHQVYVIWTHPLFHDSLRQLLDHNEIKWVGAASDFTAAVGRDISPPSRHNSHRRDS